MYDETYDFILNLTDNAQLAKDTTNALNDAGLFNDGLSITPITYSSWMEAHDKSNDICVISSANDIAITYTEPTGNSTTIHLMPDDVDSLIETLAVSSANAKIAQIMDNALR